MQPAYDFSPLDPALYDGASQDLKPAPNAATKQANAREEGNQIGHNPKGLQTYPYLNWNAENPSEQRRLPPRFRLARTVTNKLFRRSSHQPANEGLKRSRSIPERSTFAEVQNIPSGLTVPFPESRNFVAKQTLAPEKWLPLTVSEPELQTPTPLTTPKAQTQNWVSALPIAKSLSRKSSRQAISGKSIDSERPYISETSTISLPITDSNSSASKVDLPGANLRKNQSQDIHSIHSNDYFSSRPVRKSSAAVHSLRQQSSQPILNLGQSASDLASSDSIVQKTSETSLPRLSNRPCSPLASHWIQEVIGNSQHKLERSASYPVLEPFSPRKKDTTATGQEGSRNHSGRLEIKRSNSDCTDRSKRSGKEFLESTPKVEPLVLRISAPQADRLVGLISSASNSSATEETFSAREEPLVSFSILKPIPTTEDPDMAIGENSGGGWLSRLGGGGKDNSKKGQPNGGQQNEMGTNDAALLNRFMLDKKSSTDNFRAASSSPRNTMNDKNFNGKNDNNENGRNSQIDREMAAQHIARQQRAANDAKLANMIDGNPHMSQNTTALSSNSPHARLEQYRQATRNPTGLPGLERGKMGSDDMLIRKSSNITDTTGSYEERTRTMSDSGPEEITCPVCLELLSFRLAGEKQHVVPLCGHALHHACFTAVYGSVESVLQAQSSQGGKHSPPGMCGVCRRLIVLGEDRGDGKKGSKLAGMMGVGNGESYSDDRSMVSTNVSDDPLEMAGLHSSMGRGDDTHNSLDKSRYNTGALDEARNANRNRFMLLPTVKIRPEFDTIYRKDKKDVDGGQNGRQNIVCVVTVEIPSRRQIDRMEEDENHWRHKSEQFRPDAMYDKKDKGKSRLVDQKVGFKDELNEENDFDDEDNRDPNASFNKFVKNSHLHFLSPSNEANSSRERHDLPEQDGQSDEDDDEEGFSFSATPAASVRGDLDEAVDDLRNRIIDWKGHSVERFGPLSLYDYLGVRQESIVRDFYVYLFKDALLCVNEERKKEKSFARLIHADRSDDSGSPLSSSGRKSRAPLKLKGRIWLRHIRNCQDTEIDGMPCLSIRLDDESLDNFILSFKEKNLREIWRMKLNELLSENRARNKKTAVQNVQRVQNGHESNGMSKKLPESPMTHSSYGDASLSSMATRNTSNDVSLNSSHNSGQSNSTHSDRQSVHQNGIQSGVQSILTGVPNHQQWSASGGLDPNCPVPPLLPHTPIDLVIMVSVPSVTAQPSVSSSTLSSSAALKLRLIRSTLDFVITHMGPRDRISIVAYHVGIEGVVRRTALLNTSKPSSIEKLEQFVDSIGKPWEGPGHDPFREDIDRLGGNSERTDTVTAVNVGFDIILQRKSKNPITGMLLINDTADAPKRGQMDLVMARAEAANVAVHCFGFGKSHDPSSLWLISNHTHGSYTFVREWYQLRECVAGCIGALMSIALTDVRLHISVPSDNHFRVRKVTGCTGSIIASNGKDVDLDLGELRFGENREIFFELELDFAAYMMQNDLAKRNQSTAMQSPYEKGSATDDFMTRLGLKGLSITDQDDKQSNHNSSTSDSRSYHSGGSDGQFVDEVAVLEVQCGCRDPSIGMGASRLPDPCVLTIEIDSSSNDPAADGNGASGLATALADPIVTRRRLEILVSDMITRCLLLVSRRNHAQALTILLETRKIVDTVLQAIPLIDNPNSSLHNNRAMYPTRRSSLRSSSFSNRQPSKASIFATQTRSSQARKQRERLHRRTAVALMAILDDLDVLIDGLELGKAMSFDRSERNFGAQQAMVLRDQKAWTSRTDTEWQFFKTLDNGSSFAALAAQFAAGYSR